MNKGGPNSLPMAPKTTGIHSLAAPTVSQELLKYRQYSATDTDTSTYR